MTLPLTVENLAAAYEYLRTTPPFNRWNLPEGDEIKFRISRITNEFGSYFWDREKKIHIISISSASVGFSTTLLTTMAHEMIHLHLQITGMESKNGTANTHNAAFRKYASETCRVHGFDPRAFF